ncbi:MAG: CooT family nickel-binding protein [Terriglobia bacterium]
MCEARVFVNKNGEMREIMENVVTVRPDGETLILSDIFGEQKRIRATLQEVKLLDHKIILESDEG